MSNYFDQSAALTAVLVAFCAATFGLGFISR